MKQSRTASVLFILLYPVFTGAMGFFIFSPLVLLLPVLFAFAWLKIGSRPWRTAVLAASLLLTAATAFLTAQAFFITRTDALAVSLTLTALAALAGMIYAAAEGKWHSYWRSLGASAGAFAAGCVAILVVLYFAGSHDIAATMTHIFTRRCDPLLVGDTSRLGVVLNYTQTVTDATAAEKQAQVSEIFARDAETVIYQFESIMIPLVRSALIGMMACACMLTGLVTATGTALMNRLSFFSALDDTALRGRTVSLPLVSPRKLMLPRKAAISIVVVFVCALVLSLVGMTGGEVMLTSAAIVGMFVFTVLGICVVDYFLYIYRLHWAVRLIIMMVVLLLCSGSFILCLLGLIDGLFGFRKRIVIMRRPPM